ncbi:MAG: glycosyltransferase family 2 protein, partial [Acidimicrobiales bacterium]
MSEPQVTVVVPSYNYERYLRQAVESAATQTDVDVEVVVVDNASTDGSLELARQLAAQYACVRVVSFADNLGIVSSFNRCLALPRGRSTVVLCADDRLTPGSLRRSVSFLDDHPGVGMVYGPVVQFGDSDSVAPSRLSRAAGEPVVYAGSDWVTSRCRTGRNALRAPEAMFRTAAQVAVGTYDENCPYTFDLNMWLRIAANSDIGYLPGTPQALYRVHANNF